MAEAWGALADRIAAPPALHPGYFLAWAAAHSAPERLRAVAVWRDDRLTAVLPLALGGSRLTTAAMRDVEECGIVSEDAAAALAAARGALGMGVARVLLRPVLEGGPTQAAFAAARDAGAGALLCRPVDVHPVIDTAGDWEAYRASLSGKLRRELGRARRRLSELGEVSVEVLDGAGGVGDALEMAFAIEASGWKGRQGTALALKPADARMYRLLAMWAARRGWLRLALLRLDGRPLAFQLGLQAHGVLYALKIGYADDEAARRHSPGLIVIAAEIERAFSEGLRRFDFAGSAVAWNRRLGNGSRTLDEMSAFPATAAGRAAHAAALARARAIPAAKRGRAAVRSARDRARSRLSGG